MLFPTNVEELLAAEPENAHDRCDQSVVRKYRDTQEWTTCEWNERIYYYLHHTIYVMSCSSSGGMRPTSAGSPTLAVLTRI